MEHLNYTWQDLEKDCLKLADEIRASGFKPDMIMSIARGGLVPAVLFSEHLGLQEVAVAQVRLYVDDGRRGELAILDWPQRKLAGKKILLVDDISDSGQTILAVEARLKEHNIGEHKLVCLHSKPGTKRVPDFFAKETDAWVNYPWTIGRRK
jgi:hypoxanthine phosphoribosyltransferase